MPIAGKRFQVLIQGVCQLLHIMHAHAALPLQSVAIQRGILLIVTIVSIYCWFGFTCIRNEQYQDELWKISFDYLKDHLSPETVEKYGPKPGQPASVADSNETPN